MHVYSRELFLVIAAFRRDAVELARKGWHLKPRQQLQKMKDQLTANIAAYRELLEQSVDSNKERYLRELRMAKLALQRIPIPVAN